MRQLVLYGYAYSLPMRTIPLKTFSTPGASGASPALPFGPATGRPDLRDPEQDSLRSVNALGHAERTALKYAARRPQSLCMPQRVSPPAPEGLAPRLGAEVDQAARFTRREGAMTYLAVNAHLSRMTTCVLT